jgi:hypothetical protein
MRSLVDGLSSYAGRGACTDAERRAALWLHDELHDRGHEAWVETRWVRPQWAAALALGSLLAVAGSLVATTAPVPGLVLAVAGALTILLRPFPRRATQHVLTAVPGEDVVLAVCAAYDVPRRGLIAERRLRNPVPAACAVAIVGATAARVADYEPGWLGAAQLVPTVVLLLVLAAATDIALSSWAADDASGVAVALALFDELTRDPPRTLAPALLLVGAGHALPQTAARHLRSEGLRAERVVLLELEASKAGSPVWAARHSQVRAAAERAETALDLPAPAHRPRRPATRLPAIRIACPAGGEDAALDLALGVVDALDAELSARAPGAAPRA